MKVSRCVSSKNREGGLKMPNLTLRLRSQTLEADERDYWSWRTREQAREVAPSATLIIICDV